MYPLNPSKAREWGASVKTFRHPSVNYVISFIYNAEGSLVSQHEFTFIFGTQNGCVSSGIFFLSSLFPPDVGTV